MKMVLAKVVSPNFKKSLDNLSSQKLPIKAMFKLKGIVQQLREEKSKWDEIHFELTKKWSEKDESGSPIIETRKDKTTYYKVLRENMVQLAAELGELAKIEIDVTEISIKELGDISLTVDDLIELEFLVD